MGRSPEVPVGLSQASFHPLNILFASTAEIGRLTNTAGGDVLEVVAFNKTTGEAIRHNGVLTVDRGLVVSAHSSWREDLKYKILHSLAEFMWVDLISCSPFFFPNKNQGVKALNLIADAFGVPIVIHRHTDAKRHQGNGRRVGLEIYGRETPHSPEDLRLWVTEGKISGLIPDFSQRRWLEYCRKMGIGENDTQMLDLLDRMLPEVILAHVQISTPDELRVVLDKDYQSRLARLINKVKEAPHLQAIILELNFRQISRLTSNGDTLKNVYPKIADFVRKA